MRPYGSKATECVAPTRLGGAAPKAILLACGLRVGELTGMSDQPLNPGTIVGRRYIIRAFEGRLGDCLHYLADDIESGSVCTVAEYFPDGLVAREGNGDLAPAGDEAASLYEEGRKCFLSRAQELARLAHPNLAASRPPIEERNTAYAVSSGADGP